MAEESVGQLAETIGTPINRLLLQIEEAGLSQRSADDVINEADKESLLAFLKRSHGEEEGAPKKITLKRRTLSTLKTGGSAGRGRTVNVDLERSEPIFAVGRLSRSRQPLTQPRLKHLKQSLGVPLYPRRMQMQNANARRLQPSV